MEKKEEKNSPPQKARAVSSVFYVVQCVTFIIPVLLVVVFI